MQTYVYMPQREIKLIRLSGNAPKQQKLEGKVSLYSYNFTLRFFLMFFMEMRTNGIYKQNDKGSSKNTLQNI